MAGPSTATGPRNGARPSRIAIRTIELAMRMLPAGEIRHRYERELTAELFVLPGRRQAVHAATVLLSAWSLRSAVRGGGLTQGETTMIVKTRRKPLLCWLNLQHHYVWQFNSEAKERVQVCAHCGRERPDPSPHLMG